LKFLLIVFFLFHISISNVFYEFFGVPTIQCINDSRVEVFIISSDRLLLYCVIFGHCFFGSAYIYSSKISLTLKYLKVYFLVKRVFLLTNNNHCGVSIFALGLQFGLFFNNLSQCLNNFFELLFILSFSELVLEVIDSFPNIADFVVSGVNLNLHGGYEFT
jgi:hypothetical protein